MLTAQDIRNIKFSKAVGGYRADEVEEFLASVAMDYESLQKQITSMNEEIVRLKEDAQQTANSRESIQSVLIRAQELADKIVSDAKDKSAQILREAEDNLRKITAQEKELTDAFDRKASERKAAVERDLKQTVDAANLKAQSIEKALNNSIERQQLLFNRIKLEISAFKADVTKRYKEHLEILQKLPDEVPMDPAAMARAMTEAFDKAPDITEFMPVQQATQPEIPDVEPVEEIPEIPEDIPADEPVIPAGFVINTDDIEDED